MAANACGCAGRSTRRPAPAPNRRGTSSLRLNKRLLVNSRPIALASDYVRLHLNEVGTGIFEVLQRPPQTQRAVVEFYVAVGDSEEFLVLTGVLTDTRELAPGRFRIDVSELSTVLETTVVLNLFQCTARDVVSKIEGATGLRFLLPAGEAYLDQRRVVFKHYGRARDALRVAATLWEVDDAVWFQLPDGRMYWGNWARGPYTKGPLPISSDLISHRDNERHTLVLPYIPALRPGMMVQSNFRFRIDGIVYSGDTARVEWTAL